MAIRDLNSIYEYSPLFRRYSTGPADPVNNMQQQLSMLNTGGDNSYVNNGRAYYADSQLAAPNVPNLTLLNNGRGYYADQSLLNYNTPTSNNSYLSRVNNYPSINTNFKIENPFQTENWYDKYFTPPSLNFSVPVNWKDPASAQNAVSTVASSFSPKLLSAQEISRAISTGKMPWQNTLPVKKGLSAGAKGAIGAGLGLVGSIGGKLIADGYDDGGVGNTVAGVGTAIGSIASLVPGVGTVAGAAIGAASQLIGGAITRGFGVKRNEKNIAAVNSNIDNMKSTGNLLASANTYDSVLSAANNMSGGLGFSNGAIAKNGWFNSKGDKIANDLRNSQNTALAMQGQGLATGVKNADLEQKNRTANSFIAAYGGGLTRDNGMGAIDYGFMSDLLANKRKQLEVKDRLPGMVGMPNNLLALGGSAMPQESTTNDWYDESLNDNTYVERPSAVSMEKPNTLSAKDFANAGIYVDKDGKFYREDKKGNKVYMSRKEAAAAASQIKAMLAKRAAQKGAGMQGGNTMFALGGDMQTHGADFTNGLAFIDAGGSHEDNPNEGVQVGVDRKGTPNLVEEGETIFNDYVYSSRIYADGGALTQFHISPKRKITYADLSKKLQKEAEERPNDPISQAALKNQMADLAEHQERQKAEMQAEEAKAAFESLNPEEQIAIMQQVEAQDQQAAEEETAMQEQAMAEQQMQGQPSEEEMMQQQMMAQQGGMPSQMGQPEVISAYGGPINRFDDGGNTDKNRADAIRKAVLKSLGISTVGDLQKWAKDNSVTGFDDYDAIDWMDIGNNKSFIDALTKGNSDLAHVINTGGYDFGIYQPTATDNGIQSINRGNWDTSGSKKSGLVPGLIKGWEGSTDAMWQEVKDKIKPDMSLKDVENLMKNTEAYKKTTEWLRSSPDNMLAYLQAIEDSGDAAPESARRHYMFDKKGNPRNWVEKGEDGKLKWKEGYTPKYEDIFGVVRDTYPGSYWHTHSAAMRNPVTVNYVQKEDGTWDRVIDEVGEDWEKVNTYNWYGKDDNNDYTYNYYRNPKVKAAEAAKEKEQEKAEDEYIAEPIHRSEWPRYAGLFGPAAGIAMQMAGIGKPDTSGLDAAISAYSNRGSYLPSVRYTDGYYAYRPENPFIGDIAADNASAGTARAITNNAAPLGTQQASLLANAYNDQLARGTRIAQGRQYNNQERLQALNAYKNTDQFNAQAFNANEGVRAQILNQDRQTLANMRMNAAQQKLAADAGWYNSLYGNVSGLFKGFSDLGRENAQHNMIADMAATGIFGTLKDQPISTKYLRIRKKNPDGSVSAAEGGKINRKKNKRRGGLTY